MAFFGKRQTIGARSSLRAAALAAAAWLGGMSSAQAAQPVRAPGFVTTRGTHFELDGKPFYFQGTNVSFFGTTERPKEQIYGALQQLADKGLKVVRFWGYSCSGSFWGKPMITSMREDGVQTDEGAMQRLDATLDAARKAGLKVILTLVNFEPEYCGMHSWVQQITGSSDKQLFYTDQRVIRAYKSHIARVLGRINTAYKTTLGREVRYADDPTIMAVEIANEPHTQDGYEWSRGQKPGEIVYKWLADMAAFVRRHDQKHLISSGEEGYRTYVDQTYDMNKHVWINNGLKGVDFSRDVTIRDIDFATVHLYPDNLAIPSSDMWWVDQHLVKRRADIAHAAGKPILMEESGFSADKGWHGSLGYADSPAYWLRQIYGFANKYDYAGTMIWQLFPPGFAHGGYNYDFNDETAQVVFEQARRMSAKNH